VAELRPDEDRLEPALAQFMTRRLCSGMKTDARMMQDLVRLLLDFGLAFPPQIAAVFRSLMTLEGTLALLAPDLNMIDEARVQADEWPREKLAPSALGDGVIDELLELLPVLRRLPRRVDRIASALEHGTLSTNVRLFVDDRDRRGLARLVDRALLTVLAGALGLISVLLLGVQGGPMATPELPVYTVLGDAGLIAAAALAMRALIAIVQERDL